MGLTKEATMSKKSYDFSGWATKNNIQCSDGRTIRKDAFKDCDGLTVPLVYNHDHNNIGAVIGHACLENRDDGVYAYGFLNETQAGKDAKVMLKNGDITHMSIYANKLQHVGRDVVHGMIREVSLVLAGANPGAKIEYVISHGEDMFDAQPSEGDIYTDEAILMHSDDNEYEYEDAEESIEEEEDDEMAKSPDEVYEEMTEEQQDAVMQIVGAATELAVAEALEANENVEDDDDNYEDEEDMEDYDMKHNVFEDYGYDGYEGDALMHVDADTVNEIFSDAPRCGSLRESVLQHGITDIDVMFPDAKAISNDPTLISRNMDWVEKVLNATHHTPFSRVKSLFANITADEARARGYVKGNYKVEEVIKALKRATSPQTIYKKQALDRDDILDIRDFNVVAFLKSEMRIMLNEELARAILISDGRSPLSEDKIQETNIRPVWTDEDLFTIKKTVNKNQPNYAKKVIETAIRSRKEYKGSGSPTFFTTEDLLTDMLLLEDGIGRPLYDTIDKLKTALRVSDIVTVPVMENATRTVDGSERELAGIIVNLHDYNVGADNGGSVSLFEDFDIDYNKEKYLIETRCSGALTVPYSAIAIEFTTDANNAPANNDNNNATVEG